MTARHGRRVIAAGGLALTAGHGLLLAAVAGGGITGSLALMVLGLLLVGADMGLCITPLNAIVLADAEPRSAGSAAGVMSTVHPARDPGHDRRGRDAGTTRVVEGTLPAADTVV